MTISWSESFSDWWHASRALQHPTTPQLVSDPRYVAARARITDLERQLLLDAMPAAAGPQWDLIDTEVAPGVIFHECRVFDDRYPVERHVVVVHGYMAAMGYFGGNLAAWAVPGVVVHAIDWPGFGNLSRPKFPDSLLDDKEKISDRIAQVKAVERWFIDHLETWRRTHNIAQFDLVGHSMGGYLAACYYLEYGTDIVTKLVLLSPMGTEDSAFSLIDGNDIDGAGSVGAHPESRGNDPLEEVVGTEDERQQLWQRVGGPSFPNHVIVRTIWRHHLSPVGLLNYCGPLSSKMLSLWTYQRFAHNPPEVIHTLHAYSFAIFYQYLGLGERAITKLVNANILAYLPLCQRELPRALARNHTPTLVMYGTKDWMNRRGGEHLVNEIVQAGGDAQYKEIDGGHHMYLDNRHATNAAVAQFLGLNLDDGVVTSNDAAATA